MAIKKIMRFLVGCCPTVLKCLAPGLGTQGGSFPRGTKEGIKGSSRRGKLRHLGVDISCFGVLGKLVPKRPHNCLSRRGVDEEESVEDREKGVLGEKRISGNSGYQATLPETRILRM